MSISVSHFISLQPTVDMSILDSGGSQQKPFGEKEGSRCRSVVTHRCSCDASDSACNAVTSDLFVALQIITIANHNSLPRSYAFQTQQYSQVESNHHARYGYHTNQPYLDNRTITFLTGRVKIMCVSF